MPPNLYGPNDTYDLENSHVVPALIRKIHEAKKHRAEHLFLWGSGKPKREFLHVDDLAAGLLLCMLEPNTPEIMNMGSGVELTIAELAQEVKQIIGYRGMIHFDPSRPDGSPGKLMDSSIARNNLHWQATIPLRQGIKEVYQSLAREPWY
jgi:GDP-L-fucose synthase